MFGGITTYGRLLVLAHPAGLAAEIHVVDLVAGTRVHRFSYSGPSGTDAGGVAVSRGGIVHVADTRGCRVRRFTLFGREREPIGLPPEVVVPRDRRGLVAYPRALCIDPAGRLWVSCGDRPFVHGLQVFDPSGAFAASVPAFGDRSCSYGPALGLAFARGELWVADTGNGCLQRFKPDGSFVGRTDLDAEPVAVCARTGGLAVLLREPRPALLLLGPNQRREAELVLRLPDDASLPSALCARTGGGFLSVERDGARVVARAPDGSVEGTVYDLGAR